MPAHRHPANRQLVRGLGLLATASALTMAMTGVAQANCVANPAQPLNNVTTDNSQVDCSGTTTGAAIVGNANGVLVNVSLGGTQLNSSSIELNGSGNLVDVRNSASTSDLVVLMQGNAARLQLLDSQNSNISATLIGNDVELRIGGAGITTSTPGNIQLASAANSGGTFALSGQLDATGNNGGAYLVTGGSGAQTFQLFGGSTLGVQANGLAIDGGSGDDVFLIDDGAFITGGTGANILFNGGNDTDSMTIAGSGISDFNTINIEVLTIDAGTGGFRALNGTNADLTDITLLSGTTRVLDASALGVNTSQVTIAAGANLTLAASTQQSLNQSFAGAGQIVLDSPFNIYTFGGTANGFTGELVISQLNNAMLTSDTAFGTGTITNNGQVIFGGGLTVSNDISGTGAVWMAGPGQSTISGDNSYSGGTLISGGALNVAHGGALGSGLVDIDTGAFLNLDFAGDGILANDLTGVGGLNKRGAGTVTLTGASTRTGATNVLSGALRVDDLARLGTGATTVDAGASLILDYNGAGQLLQLTQVMTGGGRFIKEGTGDVVLNSASLYTGGTIIRAGRLGLNDGGALGTGPVQVDSGATLGIGNIIFGNDISGTGSVVKTASGQAVLSGNNSTFGGNLDIQNGAVVVTDGRAAGSGTVTIGAGTQLIVDSAGATTIAATLSGAGDLENLSNSRLVLTGSNTLTGTVFVSNGTLQVEGDQNIGSADVVLAGAGAVLDLSTASNGTLANLVSGNGQLVKTGAGTVFVTGANTYAGGTDIQQGALRVTDTAVLGTGAITVQQGAALDLSIAGQQTLAQSVSGAGILRKSDFGDLTLLSNGLTGGLDVTGGRVIVNSAAAIGGGPVTMGTDTQLVFDNGVTETTSTTISGAGGFVKQGAGLLVVQNANTYTGGTLVNAGRLGLNDGQGLGTGSVTVLQGAELAIGDVSLANAISGAGRVIKTASGTGVLSGANTFSGGIDIQGGNLFVSNVAALGTGTIATASGTTLTLGNATAQTLANALTGAGGLVKSGTGDLTMTANGLSGGLSIAQGRVLASGTSGTGTGAIAISSGAELVYTTAANATFANGLSGTGTLRKLGAGQLLFANPFAIGALAVDAGSVRINATMTGNATVASGARLDGTGTVAGNLTNNGTVAPGNSIGTL
ncbi:MAG: autotransporter-associated beta strand repeat-containing protein, partial [Erythrobacter sp.]|nr:autotransporter-associated beta strand repeat-containing protein [Erythrobacter sp.]